MLIPDALQPKRKQTRGFQIFTVLTLTVSLYVLITVTLTQMLLKDPWERPEVYPAYYAQFLTYSEIFLYILYAWAYIVAASTDPGKCHNILIGESGGYCSRCSIVRPERSHHCSACDACIAKMDHHCVWINRCVGYHNYKGFFLFVFYLMIYLFIYSYCSTVYLIGRYYDQIPPAGQGLNAALMWVMIGLSYLFSLFTFGLLASHIMIVLLNSTTLEFMKGKTFRFPICVDSDPVISKQTNTHDMGLIPNFLQIFGRNPFLWYIPSEIREREWGQFYANPPGPGYNVKLSTSEEK